MDAPFALTERIAEALSGIPDISAVALGGSWARGTATADSDVDIGVYYRGARRPSLDVLRDLAVELDDRGAPESVAGFGEWGPWINGGAFLQIEGRRVDWLWRDLDRVTRIVNECRAGYITCDYQPGHPHGFHNHMYLGETYCCRPLLDPDGLLATLKDRVAVYPSEMREAIVRRYLWEASWSISVARKATNRKDVVYVTGCLYRCVACLVQVLFALNERYFLNEKGSVHAVQSFELKPQSFVDRVDGLLSRPGSSARSLDSGLDKAQALTIEIQQLMANS